MAFTYITGSGTQADPYVITDINGMNELATYVTSGNMMEGEYVELGADIDYQNGDINTEAYGTYNFKTFNTIGNANYPFCGTFDGKSYTLKSIRNTVFICSSNVCIKNISIINFINVSASAIIYNSKSILNKTPLFENIVFSTKPYAGNTGYGNLINIQTSSSGNDFSSTVFTINKCFCYGIVGNQSFYINWKGMVALENGSKNTGYFNININDCVLINMVPIEARGIMPQQTIALTNVIAYYPIIDLLGSTYDSYPYKDMTNTLNVTNCYVVHASNHTEIDHYYSSNWNRLTYEQCLDSSNFNNWDFTNVWSIDTGMKMPIINFAYNRYVHIFATSGGTSDILMRGSYYTLGTKNNSFCYYTSGCYGLVEKGTNVNFGVTHNVNESYNNIHVNFIRVKNLTTEEEGEDYQTYLNIQNSLVYRYEIKPCFDGDGTEENPFLIKTYYDFRAILEYSSQFYQYCSYLNIRSDYLSGYYASIENDIIMNDVSNFNNWHNTAPTNQVNGQRTDVNINGNNHRIIGLYLSSSSHNSNIRNIKFDYVYGSIRFDSSANIYDCEFNGNFYFYNTNATFYRCFINFLPRNNMLYSYANGMCYDSSSYPSNPTFINCIINSVTPTIRASGRNPSFTNCILFGTYYKTSYYNSSQNADLYPTFNNSYMIEESIIKKETVPGLTYISYNDYIHSTVSMYNNFDFTNIFELYNKVINGNNEYITIPILKNMAPRFSFISVLNDDYYGLNNVSLFYYMQKLPSYENTGETQVSVTVTPNTNSYFSKWDDNGSGNPLRSFTNYDDNYVTYNLLPNCGNVLTGKGTENEPYLITSKTDLVNIINWYNNSVYSTSNNINQAHFKITANIEFQECSNWESWVTTDPPESFTPFKTFKGYIDGDGHTISGLFRHTIESNYSQYSTNARFPSLFMSHSDTSDNARTDIRNLNITKSVIKREFAGSSYNYPISFISCGYNAYIINCKFSGIIVTSSYQVTIAGMCSCSHYLYAENCTSDIQITVSNASSASYYQEHISGMFYVYYNGSPRNSTIKKCTNKGHINCTNRTNDIDRYIAGIFVCSGNFASCIDISESYNKGNITATNSRVCGIAIDAYNVQNGSSRSSITNCYNVGNITTSTTSTSRAYGIGGIEYRVARAITNCYNYGNLIDTINTSYVFAISRFDSSSVNVSNCYYLENTAPNAGGGTSLTAENFILPTSLVGFDFVNTWIVDQSAGRPKLINNYEGSSSSLIVTSSNPNYGTVSGGGDYDYGEIAVITATPFAGCEFIVWSDGKRTNPREIVVNRNMMFQAMFKGEYPIRVLDYYGLITFLTDLKTFIATNMATKVDKVQSGDYNTPVYFNATGVPTPCTALDLDTSGNAGTATKLETSRNISGVPFDGTSDITIAPSDIGLGNVDNTSDMDKPVSTATQNALTVLADDITGITYDNITYQMIDDIFNE